MSEKNWQKELNAKRIRTANYFGCTVPDGWKDLVLKTDEMLAFIDPDYEIHQIKDKFGGMRYYFGTSKDGVARDIMYSIAHFAELKSYSICETCGTSATAKLRTRGVCDRTLCNDHAIEQGFNLERDDDD